MPLRVFPVAGGASYQDDWGFPRAGHAHEGNDLFAPEGTPVLAVDDGRLTFGTDPIGGSIAVVRATDGVMYYYAHLSRFEGAARSARAGEVIGYVGRTGNAASTAPHVHFEMRPGGGARIDPFPHLRAAQVRRAPSTGASLLVPALLIGAAGLAYWGASKPNEARALARRWGLVT